MIRHRQARHAVRTTTAVGLVAACTVALAEHSASGAFSAASGSAGNQVSTAPAFCSGPGSVTLSTNTQVVDTWLDQSNPTVGKGGDKALYTRSWNGKNIRSLVRFTLPSLPAGCSVTSATMRMTVATSTTGSSIGVYRVTPGATWDEYTVTWNTQPTVTTDVPATSAPGATASTQSWTVTALVSAQYAEGNNGFLVRDQSEDSATQIDNRWRSREDGFPPQLSVSWA